MRTTFVLKWISLLAPHLLGHPSAMVYLLQMTSLAFYHALTSKFSSGKYVATTVLSANFLPASALNALVADSGLSNFT